MRGGSTQSGAVDLFDENLCPINLLALAYIKFRFVRCSQLCRKNGGNIEQIKFLLGHSSIQTTEHYLGSEQEIEIAVNDNLGL